MYGSFYYVKNNFKLHTVNFPIVLMYKKRVCFTTNLTA